MFPSVVLYLALAIILAGLVSLIVPLRVVRIRSRRRATVVLIGGLLAAAVALMIPSREYRAGIEITALDRFVPVWQFEERHTIHVGASPDRVFEAIRATRARDIVLFRALTTIRRLGRSGPESILEPSEDEPILDVATRTGFFWLADEAPEEIVVGTLIASGESAASREDALRHFTSPGPGTTLAAMNFLVKPDGNSGSIVSTETRVRAIGSGAVRRFRVYWRFIRPGSGIIRVMWLRAIKERAEAGNSSVSGD